MNDLPRVHGNEVSLLTECGFLPVLVIFIFLDCKPAGCAPWAVQR